MGKDMISIADSAPLVGGDSFPSSAGIAAAAGISLDSYLTSALVSSLDER